MVDLDTDLVLADATHLDFGADDIFYRTKGQLYAYYMLLRELSVDYEGVITERKLGGPGRTCCRVFDPPARFSPGFLFRRRKHWHSVRVFTGWLAQ